MSSGSNPAPSGAAGTEGAPPLAPPAAGGSANAGAGAAGAAGGMADGENSGAGAAGAPMGMGGSTGLPEPPPGNLCVGSVSNGGMCLITCTDDCGVHALGLRLCTCTAGAYDCASCEFATPHPLTDPPTAPLPDCALQDEDQENDESGCTDNERCQSIGRTTGASGENRYCGCLDNSWDCDSKPASFGD
ncbi:MAG TPA: hypothetical protein VMG12_12060 [Polyangiaceae bacterium]|nr:hypothetical protein [Polyangiaceae bacterium]